jgi:acyl CoA:acetate/3-ketoacid CoA transferase beta subunit
VQCVKKIVTDLAVLDVDQNGKGFILRELAPGVTVDEVKAKTEGKLIVEGNIPEMGI